METFTCNFVHVTLINSSLVETDCPLVTLGDMNDESIPVLRMGSWVNYIFIILLLIGCVAMNSFGKAFTVFYIKQSAPERPLNDMILIDQCLQLPPSFLHGFLVTSSVIMKQPLVNILGNYGCNAMYVNIAIHNILLIVGGAGMAFYRLITYKMASQINIEDLQKIKKFILHVEFLIGSLMIGLFLLAAYYTNVATHLDFCRGYTKNMRYIISVHEQEDNAENIHLGEKMNNIALIMCQLIILFEFLCYLTIMVSIYLHDKKMAQHKVIDTKVMKQRTKKNAITMTGQCLSFMVELGYAMLLLILYNWDGWGIFKYGNISVLLIFCWTAITLIQIGTSPEIRTFLKGRQVDVVPTNMSLVHLLHSTLTFYNTAIPRFVETNELAPTLPTNDIIEMATFD